MASPGARSTMRRTLTALALLLGLPLSVAACLWDRDTPAGEAKGMLEVVAVLTGRFERNPPLFYEMRSLAAMPRAGRRGKRLDPARRAQGRGPEVLATSARFREGRRAAGSRLPGTSTRRPRG